MEIKQQEIIISKVDKFLIGDKYKIDEGGQVSRYLFTLLLNAVLDHDWKKAESEMKKIVGARAKAELPFMLLYGWEILAGEKGAWSRLKVRATDAFVESFTDWLAAVDPAILAVLILPVKALGKALKLPLSEQVRLKLTRAEREYRHYVAGTDYEETADEDWWESLDDEEAFEEFQKHARDED